MDEQYRKQKLAEIKSSNELLEECKQKILDNEKIDEQSKKDRIAQIDEAISENYKAAAKNYNATKKEVDSMTYRAVSEEYKEKYANRLKKKGLTDEQLHQKESAEIIVATAEEEPKIKKRHRRTKRTEQRDDENGFDGSEINRLSNEEELMKKSLAKDSKDLERRRHRSTDTMSDKPKNPTVEDAIGSVIETKKVVSQREEASTSVVVDGSKEKQRKETMRILGENKSENKRYDFDLSQIPSYIQYDILPLPSNGECYPHKKNRIPVAYLTAADENIIASPNMYRDGKLIDIILERKILDKDIKVSELCKGDRDAIVLWLRATGYGSDFPIVARHPETGKQYPINVKLDTFKYYPFNLKGDEDGYFEYKTESGDVIKFKYLNVREEEELRNNIIERTTDFEKFTSIKYVNMLKRSFANMNVSDNDKKELDDCLEDIKDILNEKELEIDADNIYSYSITDQMVKYTMSINGNTDKDYIKGYIENMRAKDALTYRTFVNDNTPGVNMKINVNVPQSDGGGTFETFLGIDDYVFGNI